MDMGFFKLFFFFCKKVTSLKYSFHVELRIQCLGVESNLKNVKFQSKVADLGEIYISPV